MPVPDFVLELRRHVGTAPLWLIGVTAVVVHDDLLLVVRRADTGAWTPVTGIVDPGEHPAHAAVRETWEEARIRVAVRRLAAVTVTEPVRYDNGDRAQYLDHTFLCDYLEGTAAVGDDENTDVAWVPLDALPPMSAHMRARVDAALADESAPRLC